MFHGISTTVIGDSHVKKGKVCQDSSGTVVRDEYAIAAVADGHGSARHFRSDVGSRIAVKITCGLLSRYLDRMDFRDRFRTNPDFILGQLEKQILMKWTEAVEEYHREHPVTEAEKEALKQEESRRSGRRRRSAASGSAASGPGDGKRAVEDRTEVIAAYGTTILAAAMTRDLAFGIVLGDGGFVVLDEADHIYIPVEDPNARANYTSSLCNTNAIRYFEHWHSMEKIKALFVSTDGLYKSFASEEDFLRYHGLIARMYDDPERTLTSLNHNFEKRTREGSGDDISMALVYRE